MYVDPKTAAKVRAARAKAYGKDDRTLARIERERVRANVEAMAKVAGK